MVRIQVGGHPIDFMVDTGAELCVVTQPVAPLLGKKPPLLGLQVTKPTGPSAVLDDVGQEAMK